MEENNLIFAENCSNVVIMIDQHWFALKSRAPFQLSEMLSERGIEIYLPVKREKRDDGVYRTRLLIPKLMFIHTTKETAKELEGASRKGECGLIPFWVYRFNRGGEVQPIAEREFRLFRLLTCEDEYQCEIYNKEEFKIGDRLRVTSGPFAGYEGYARRIRKNKHIVVEIEGLCAIALPFIRPEFLEKI